MNEMNLSTNNKKNTDYGVGFLGETNSLITYAALSTYFGVTLGTINSTSEANKWLHFTIDDKELYVSKVAIRSAISWNHLYSKGLVYGTSDNGLFPEGSSTNQYRTITLNGKLYKCRLLKGCNEGQDPYTHISGNPLNFNDPPNSYTSEWSRLFYPIITDDPYTQSYTGPMLGSYTEADLQMRWINAATTPGSFSWCQERHVTDTTSRVIRGYNGPSGLVWVVSSNELTTRGWRAVLELI